MEIKILFFGIIAEETGRDNLIAREIYDTDSLNNMLYYKYPNLRNYTFRIAVNRMMISENTKLNSGDEVALLPPFAGG